MIKLYKNIFFLLFLCLVSLKLPASLKHKDSTILKLQNKFEYFEKINADSSYYYAHQLIKHFENRGNDSLQFETHIHLGHVFLANKSLDSSFQHFNIAYNLANKNTNKAQIIQSLLSIAYNYSAKSKLNEAISYYNKALVLSQKHNFPYKEATILISLGNIYWEQASLQSALLFFLKANTIIEKNRFKSLHTNTLLNIANVYATDEQWLVALEKMKELLIIATKEKNKLVEGKVYNNIGTIYEGTKEYKKAIPYYYKALKIMDSMNMTSSSGIIKHNIGTINYHLGDYNRAIKFLTESMKLSLKTNAKLSLVYNYEILARVYIKLKKFNKANNYLIQSIAFAEELNLFKKLIELKKLQSEYYFKRKQLRLAYTTLLEHDSIKNDWIKKEKSKEIIQMQTLYETGKKEKENELLKAKNQLSQLNLKKEILKKNQSTVYFGISIAILIVIIFFLRKMFKANKTINEFNIKLKNSNEKLKLINHTKDKFLSIIAHDLRSPLGAILSFSNLISNECISSKNLKTVKEYNTYLNQSASNLNSLLENLLQWAKSQRGAIKHNSSCFELSKIIKENIEIQKLKAQEKSINIKYKVNETVSVYADVNMVNTIIRNLLNNALKFSFPESDIIISTKIKDNMIQLSIEDNGIGISQLQQNRLFEISGNISTLGTNKETGTGLGTILCKEFTEANGGEIWIESEENKGSIFTFSIPLKQKTC